MDRETRTYSLIIQYDKEQDGYLAYFPSLRGCHSWGATYESALEKAEEALLGYIEALANSGRSAPIERHRAPGVSLGLVVDLPVIV
jgi:predicted RNase H-like HicB family nuclease